MDIYERLINDHEKQRALAARIMETSGDSSERQTLFEKFKSELDAHALAEEQAFYSELMKHPDGTEKARHSVAEHKDVDDFLQELGELQFGNSGWIHRFEKLQKKVIHHLDEEEKDVFPLARQLITDKRSKELCSYFTERKQAEVA